MIEPYQIKLGKSYNSTFKKKNQNLKHTCWAGRSNRETYSCSYVRAWAKAVKAKVDPSKLEVRGHRNEKSISRMATSFQTPSLA
jgi:hypothetical protein